VWRDPIFQITFMAAFGRMAFPRIVLYQLALPMTVAELVEISPKLIFLTRRAIPFRAEASVLNCLTVPILMRR
jgi:hypothetical protein